MNQDRQLMDTYKKHAESLEIPTDLTQRVLQDISGARPRAKHGFKLVYVLAAVLAVAVLTGFTLVVTQWKMVDMRTGDITHEPKETHFDQDDEAKLQRIADEIAPTVPEGQYADISIKVAFSESNGGGLSILSRAVWGPEPDTKPANTGHMTDESFFKQLCESSEIRLPFLSSYDGMVFSLGELFTNTEPSPKPVKTVQVDENTTIEYYWAYPEAPAYKLGTQYRTYLSFYELDQDEICIQVNLHENGGGSQSGFPEASRITRTELAGWDNAFYVEASGQGTDDPDYKQNYVMLYKELGDSASVSVSVQAKTTPIQTLLDIASNIH